MKIIKYAIAILFVALIVLMAFATYMEQRHGTAFVAQHIYHTLWFCALWGILTTLAIIYIINRKLNRRLPIFMLHGAFVVILIGSAITYFTGKEGKIHLREGVAENTFLEQASGQMLPLPFSLTLKSFQITCYPGTDTPSDFVSTVTCQSPNDSKVVNAEISMNNILRHHGYRFYQDGFDPDHKGTTLSVNHDPWGTAITYIGYLLLALSMTLTLISRKESFRRLLSSPALRRGSVLFVLAAPMLTAHAEEVPTINAEKAKIVARYQVVYNSRVVPLNTVATDFLQKIYGRHSYKGLSAEQVLYGWIARPDAWKSQRFIQIKHEALRQRLGITGEYAAMEELFDANGKYKLMPMVHEEQKKDAMGKAIKELDEKAGLILMLTSNTLFTPLAPTSPRLSDTRVEAEIIYNKIPATKILFIVNLVMGFLTFILLMANTSIGRWRRARHMAHVASVAVFGASFAFALLTYALRWYVGGRVPLSNGYETMLLMALLLMAITLAIHRRFPYLLPFGFLLSGFTLLVSHLGSMNPQITPLMPVLHSPLLSIHVSVIMTAYALLALMAMQGAFALWLMRDKTPRRRRALIDQVTTLNRVMLFPSVFLLAVGIFLGAVWANVSWGKYWSWDPKETWALITLMTYAVPLHRQSLPLARRDKQFNIYITCAFLCVLMTFFGVNYFLGGMHAYA